MLVKKLPIRLKINEIVFCIAIPINRAICKARAGKNSEN